MSERKRVQIKFEGQGRTKQAFRDECDVNQITERWMKTGIDPRLLQQELKFGDVSNPMDYQDCLDTVMAAQDTFDALPAKVRERMENDPKKLVEFVADPANDEEAIALGLKTAPKVEPIPDAPIVDEPVVGGVDPG